MCVPTFSEGVRGMWGWGSCAAASSCENSGLASPTRSDTGIGGRSRSSPKALPHCSSRSCNSCASSIMCIETNTIQPSGIVLQESGKDVKTQQMLQQGLHQALGHIEPATA